MTNIQCPKCGSLEVEKTGLMHDVSTGPGEGVIHVQYRCRDRDCKELFHHPSRNKNIKE